MRLERKKIQINSIFKSISKCIQKSSLFERTQPVLQVKCKHAFWGVVACKSLQWVQGQIEFLPAFWGADPVFSFSLKSILKPLKSKKYRVVRYSFYKLFDFFFKDFILLSTKKTLTISS